MNKIYLVMLTVFLNLAMFSCSPQNVSEDNIEPQACCGDDIPIPPPPPTGD